MKIVNQQNYNIQRQFGIYLIRNKIDNLLYVGSTRQSFRARFSNHLKFLRSGRLQNIKLQTDFNKLGEDAFEFEILSVVKGDNNIAEIEQEFIDNLNPYYNRQRASNNSKTNNGRKFTDEHKEKLRLKSKNFKHQDLEKITNQNKQGASKWQLTDSGRMFESTVDVSKFYNTSVANFLRKFNKGDYHGLVRLKTQAKHISLYVDNEWIEFSSFEKCDKFLNKWRGFTSTQTLRNVKEIEGYLVKYSN